MQSIKVVLVFLAFFASFVFPAYGNDDPARDRLPIIIEGADWVEVTEEGIMFGYYNPVTEEFLWTKERGSPLCPDGAWDVKELLDFLDRDLIKEILKDDGLDPNQVPDVIRQMKQAVLTMRTDGEGPKIRGDETIPPETDPKNPKVPEARIGRMYFGNPEAPGDFQVESNTVWAGDHPLPIWKWYDIVLSRTVLDDGQIITSTGSFAMPKSCCNYWRLAPKFEVAVDETNLCLPDWEKVEVVSREKEGTEVVEKQKFVRRYQQTGEICDQTILTARIPIEIQERTVRTEVQVPAPCDPCQLPGWNGWTNAVVAAYEVKNSKARKVKLIELSDGKWDNKVQAGFSFWTPESDLVLDSGQTVKDEVISQIIRDPELRDEKIQHAVILFNRCTGFSRLFWYREGWHWKEFFLGFLAGLPVGFGIGRVTAACDIIPAAALKAPFRTPSIPLGFASKDPLGKTGPDGPNEAAFASARSIFGGGMVPLKPAVSAAATEKDQQETTAGEKINPLHKLLNEILKKHGREDLIRK